MKEDARASWLALCRTPALGPVGHRQLLEFFGTPEQVLAADTTALEKCRLKPATLNYFKAPDWDQIQFDLEWLDQPHHHLVTCTDAAYPQLLKEIPDAPIVLFVSGDVDLLQTIQVSIVGSRNPSAGGKDIAYEFSRQLALCGITVTSGMALGIDYSSHVGALDVNGRTIAVLGNGMDTIYPARHKSLTRRIVENGALVSEFPLGTKPLAKNFPRRNRIISGMSTGVLVVEAAQRSGSLITARYAMEQGREVFAIPGSIHSPLARGCHLLIKQGAKLVETVQDIIEELGPLLHAVSKHESLSDKHTNVAELPDDDYNILLENMAYDPISVDKLVECTGLTADAVSSMLLILELRGHISLCPGGFYVRVD